VPGNQYRSYIFRKKEIMKIKAILVVVLSIFYSINVSADEIYLKNGDKITGDITEERQGKISIATDAMGVVYVNKRFVDHVVSDKQALKLELAKEKEVVAWTGEVSAGYNASRGNTDIDQLSIRGSLKRKREKIDEFDIKGNMYYSASDKKMDAQTWYGLVRYALSFGKTKQWYNFYSVEVDHDRFANIDYRAIPAVGVGYWFFDRKDIKLLTELGVGWEYTNYRGGEKDSNHVTLMPRLFFEKQLFANSKISQNLIFYPALDDIGAYYRLRSETAFTLALNKALALRLSLIDYYNSDPPRDTKKNDLRFISSLAYSF